MGAATSAHSSVSSRRDADCLGTSSVIVRKTLLRGPRESTYTCTPTSTFAFAFTRCLCLSPSPTCLHLYLYLYPYLYPNMHTDSSCVIDATSPSPSPSESLSPSHNHTVKQSNSHAVAQSHHHYHNHCHHHCRLGRYITLTTSLCLRAAPPHPASQSWLSGQTWGVGGNRSCGSSDTLTDASALSDSRCPERLSTSMRVCTRRSTCSLSLETSAAEIAETRWTKKNLSAMSVVNGGRSFLPWFLVVRCRTFRRRQRRLTDHGMTMCSVIGQL